jgi:hypothetical protein
MQGWRRFGGRIGLVCVVFASGYLGAHFRMASAPVVEASHQFNDVPNSAFYHGAVDFMVDNGITSGCNDSPPLYCGEQPVTRGQIAVLLERTANLLVPDKTDRPFHAFVICPGGVIRFAVVSSVGGPVRGSAGTTASRLTEGTYVISFDINVSACSWQVTVGQTGSDGATTGVANVAGRSGNANGLFITTHDVVLL